MVVSPQNQQLVIFVLICILLTFLSRHVIPEREDKNDVQSNKKKKKEKKKKKKKKHKKKSGEPSPASSGSDSDTIYPSDLLKKAESTPPRYDLTHFVPSETQDTCSNRNIYDQFRNLCHNE